MLVTDAGHMQANDYLNERFQKAYAFLRDNDLAALPLGRNEIDGDDVFANVQEYTTVPATEKRFEAHRRYYDLQYVVEGVDLMEYAPLNTLQPVQSFDEESDFGLYDGEAHATVVLHACEFAIVAPEDAHKPGCAVGAPAKVRKIVVKVRA